MTALLISRFLLHLQEANLRAVGMASSQAWSSHSEGSVIFERVVGSLGASITPGEFLFPGGDLTYSDHSVGGNAEKDLTASE